MFRSRSWFGGGLWKPKNPHSLEHLKYLYNVLSKNQTVSENNRGLLVETLRSIAEILIWGDQNDGSVFDFFLEKNMLSFFLKIMKQKCGSYVCVQLLQTLNILFENIRNETSLYYLLSNNHVNSIIVHKFDFSDEEVMAYYISFLKTLSFKLNTHTIHFFYNEHTNDFPLYTEAIKFFNHSESMVRIAVRTLTLNVYRVDDKSMLKFIGDRTAAPYFSNLVWFIGNHVLELDNCVRNDSDHQSKGKLADLVAEHLDHLHYLNDILCLEIGDLNCVLTDQLLHRLLMPLYVLSLAPRSSLSQETLNQGRPFVSRVVALFLLSQVFLIITHAPLVHTLAWIILNADSAAISDDDQAHKVTAQAQSSIPSSIPKLVSPPKPAPTEEQEMSYEERKAIVWKKAHAQPAEEASSTEPTGAVENGPDEGTSSEEQPHAQVLPGSLLNITDEEKEKRRAQNSKSVSLAGRPFLEAIFAALDCSENDYVALFALCLLYSMGHNKGVNENLLDRILFPAKNSQHWYNGNLIEKLIHIVSLSCQMNSKVRLVSLEMSLGLLQQLVLRDNHSYLHDGHLAAIEGSREESTGQLRTFFKGDEIFLDMFEEECNERKKGPLNVEWLMMDSNILLPPTGTPMTGIEFSKRLPCGEGERTRRTIRAFLLVRELSQSLGMGSENHLPLTNASTCVQVEQVLDLNNSDLIACTVVTKDGQKIRRFLVIDVLQLILVEPDTRRLGWGVAKFVGFLQDLEVTGDKDDSRCLHITVHRPLSSNTPNRLPLLSAKFVFDDHIRCMAAKQRLTKGRNKARQKKMQQIARLLEIPANQTTPSPPSYSLTTLRLQERASRNLLGPSRPLFSTAIKAPGFAAAVRREESGRSSRTPSPSSRTSNETAGLRSRDGSPKMPRPRSEEIPLEDMATSSQEMESSSSGLPQQDPTNMSNSSSSSSSSSQQVGRGATRRRHMEASRRLLSPSPRRASESPSRMAQALERSSSPSNSPSSTPPIPSSHPETETSFTEVPRNNGDPNGNASQQTDSAERKKKKGAVEII